MPKNPGPEADTSVLQTLMSMARTISPWSLVRGLRGADCYAPRLGSVGTPSSRYVINEPNASVGAATRRL